ncbi:MAG TPA: BrnA antitoxin family protein [Beijerinckiaceae bacterium]
MRATDEEMRARREAEGVRFDAEKARTHPMPDRSDADEMMDDVDMDWATTELPLPRPKRQTTLRLDADMADWFRSLGPGYQTRMNAVLRAYYLRKSKPGDA